MARLYKLPPAETYDIAVDKNLAVPMPDGVVLRADHYYPRHAPNRPTLLIRTPYGRSRLGVIWGSLFPERGFQVLIQSCRGTDDSGGEGVEYNEINAFRGERADGLATLEWLKSQDWFDGRLGMAGPSYMGFTQWAVARDAGPMLKAFSTQVTSSEFRSAMYPGGSFNLEIFLQWMQITHSLKGSLLDYLRDVVNAGRRMKAATSHLPLYEADQIAVGEPKKFWRDWLQHTEPGDEWWAAEDYSQDVADVTAPNHLISGWYDFLLPQLLRDYAALERAGRKPYLTIGPWSHSSNGLAETGVRESLLWLRAHLLGETKALRASPVRIYVMGADEWLDLAAWPPSHVQPQRWYLQPEAALTTNMPPASQASQFRYDPADPTPNVGGATNDTLGRGTGAQDNRKLEARPDVLVFTSPPLERDTDIIGPVTAELFIKSSLEHTDFFVRLCDVHPDGKSMNVCDGLLRLFPGRPAADPDGCRKVVIDLAPTAYRFKRGHRIRVQVSSGAFPRFARNLGTGEPLATGTTMRVAEQQIYHDPAHPSAIILPVQSPANRITT
ncbi:MAG: CocE/NonD family hydrolase [Chloroflexi bacterium]|nr:CocE/NonD family hydrolase [Chloroflexota bacterium]